MIEGAAEAVTAAAAEEEEWLGAPLCRRLGGRGKKKRERE